jgi:endoribonuclease Nob1
MNKNNTIYLIDTSAILSGRPLIFNKQKCVTSPQISNELSPGGRDYFNFQMLLEKGLLIMQPSKQSLDTIRKIIKEYGEIQRLSNADQELLALAYEIQEGGKEIPIIITDDYSIQNIANELHIKIQSLNQQEITKRFKWGRRCRGCGKNILDDVDVCPICGSSIKTIIIKKKSLKK